MTSVEKRRSGRKGGGHRKHSDGGYSDTSSGGSFLDETDREVSNLTDRAFRSLCIGDEAVYNDSDLGSSSPCSLRDRQRAFSQSGQDSDREDREREELKRAAHESFSLRVQHYEQDWIHGGMYGAKIQRDPQWELYGDRRTQGRVSATFQHSFVETSEQEQSLREEQPCFLSNGATELQQRRSRSRVSSLIRAFDSEGHREGAGMDGKLREWNDDTSWDKSALMSIQRELSEFSTSHQQNFNSGHFPSAGLFSAQDTNLYSSEVAQMNTEPSFMRSSHSKHSMSAQVNCNSNFFIHSEFSPFKVWRNHNRFPFQQGEVSGFMHCSEFPKWYQTPMYKELSLEARPQGPYRFEERGIRHPGNNLAPVVPPTLSRSTSTSTMLQKALAVEKRCESELLGHYPHRKRTQSLGTNRLPSQRPSTASPTIEMSRRVQDTISSVKALQQKIKMMTEQNIATGMTANQGVLCSNDNLIPFGNSVVNTNTSTTPFSISQLLTPLVGAHQGVQTPEVRQHAASPQPVEHPPVRAESRGATPDVKMSSYKSRATSLLFNLKDNRKRVKSTYSPTKFKGLETLEKNKQPSIQEPRHTVIDIPDFPDTDFPQGEDFSRTNAATQQYVDQYHSPGSSLAAQNYQPAAAHTGQYSQYTTSDYQSAHMQSEMVHHTGFTGFIPENYAGNQLANGRNLHEDISSFTPFKQGKADNTETLGGDLYRLKPSYTAPEVHKLNSDQPREYLIRKAKTEEHFNETVVREFTKLDRYQQHKDNKHDYSNVSSQDRWRPTNGQDTERLKTAISPWKQEIAALMEKDPHTQAYERADVIKEELNIPREKYRENQQSINKELEKTELRESFNVGTSPHKKAELVNPNISNQLPQYVPFSNDPVENPAYYGQQQHGAFKDKYVAQNYQGYFKEIERKDLTQNDYRYTDQEKRNEQTIYANKDKSMLTENTSQRKLTPKRHEMQTLQPIDPKQQFEQNINKHSFSNPDNASSSTILNPVEHRQFVEVKAEPSVTDHIKAQHAQAELAKDQHWAQVEQPKEQSARIILAGRTGSEKVKAEVTEHESVNQTTSEHVKDKDRKEEKPEQSRENQSHRAAVEQTTKEQTRVQKVTEELKNITEETGAKRVRVVQGEQVKAQKDEAARLKEGLIKTEPAKTVQAKIKPATTEQARGEMIKAEQLEAAQVREKQVKREQMEAEQSRAEKVKAEQLAAERSKAEQAQPQQLKEPQAKAEQEKPKVAKHDSTQVGHANAEQHASQVNKSKEGKVEDRKAEQAMLEQTRAELTKSANMQERFAKSAAKLTMAQQDKSEPDKVEQVKTELAKAKAELAKIKEKMRGEQKEKVRNAIPSKEDGIKRDVPLRENVNKNEGQDKGTQMHQQKEEFNVSRQNTDQANRGAANEYERLREKYGFTDTALSIRNKLSAAGSNDNNITPSSLNNVETMNSDKPKDKHSPTNRFTTADTGNKEEIGSFKLNEVTESHYVYSESSKEFKLSSSDYLQTDVDRENGVTAADKVKDNSVKLENSDPPKLTDVTQQINSDLAKSLPFDRRPRSAEHSAGNDPHSSSSRALSQKERAQTKQEILTSKIKAHAEKEISAIKERGFALRDGFIPKTPAKQLASSQNINIRQRPPSQEVSKKHGSTIATNHSSKQHMEPSETQMEPVKSVSPPSSATIPVKSAAATSQLVDPSQKQVAKEPVKSKDNVPKPTLQAKQIESHTLSSDEGLVENQRKENQSGIKSPIPSKEQQPKNKQGKLGASHEEITGKQKERLKDHFAVTTEHLNKKKEDTPQAAAVATESSTSTATDKAESKHAAVHEDSAPSLNVAFGQNETPLDDDNLQIMGIMVTVRERKPSVNKSQRNSNTQEQMNAKEKESSNLDKCHPSSDQELSKGNELLKEANRVNVVQNTHPTVEDQTKNNMKNHSENQQENSTPETGLNNRNITIKKTNLQQMNSSTNARPQSEMQPQEPLTEKDAPSTATVPAKNKVSAETQHLDYKQDKIARETKDYTIKNSKEISAKSTSKDEEVKSTGDKNLQNWQTAHSNENFVAIKESNTNQGQTETLIKQDSKPSMKEDMTAVINPLKSKDKDRKNSSELAEKKHNSTPRCMLNKTSPSDQLPDIEKIHTGEGNQVDGDVHIGCIAIKVVPAVTEADKLNMVGKHVTTVPSDGVVANEFQQAVTSSHVEEFNEDRNKDLTPASNKKQKEDKLGIQFLKELPDSSKISNQQNSISIKGETQAENGKPNTDIKSGKSVDQSKIQLMAGDYFQVQGLVEANVGDRSDTVSKGREFPGLQPNEASINNESSNGRKDDVFVLDQSKIKTESSLVSIQDESMKGKNRETEDGVASKQSDGPTERQSNKNERIEGGQAIYMRKQHTDNHSSLSARQRHSSRNPHPTRENTAKEKPEVKPKLKERVSAIPEISALADYARLKVIVSEDRADTIQEFPPNKKEGFFPLIQTRHSRRPVLTADPQDLSVKEKSLPSKTEASSKVNKEPKPLVFPITEKEHKRTGMFKLGDKERQEKMLFDSKVNENVLDTTNHLKTQRSEAHNSGSDIQGVCQVDTSIQQPNNPSLQATTSSSAFNRPRNTPVSQHQKPHDVSNPHDELERFSTKTERMPNLDEKRHPQPTLGQVYNIEDSKQTIARKDEKIGKTLAMIGDERPEKLRQERLASGTEGEKGAENVKVKHLIKESRASLAEEERRAAQREEERRAREREAIANQIKERREKQRDAERRAEEERQAKIEEKGPPKDEETRRMKETEDHRIKLEDRRVKGEEDEWIKENEERKRVKHQKEDRAAREEHQRRAAQEQQQMRSAQEEQKMRATQEEQPRRAAQEEQLIRAAQEEQQRRAAQEQQQKRAAHEEQQKRAAQEEQLRRAAQEEQQRRAAQEEQQKRAAQEEQQRRAAQEEQQKRAAQEEQQQRRAAQEEQQKRAAQEEQQQRRAAQEEQQKRAAHEDQQKRAALEEQQKRAAHKEQLRRAAQEEQQQRAAQEEQLRRGAQEEQQKRAAQEEQLRRGAQEEQQKRAAQEEQLRRAAQEEQQKRAAQEEQQQRRAAQEEQQKRAAHEEQQKRAAQEEQLRRAAQEEQQKRAAQEEQQQRRAAQEEQQKRRAAQEQQKRAVHKEQLKRAALEEQQSRTSQEQQQKRAVHEEQLRRAAQEEQQMRAALEEQQKRAAHEEQQRKASREEEQRKAAQEEKQRRALLKEQQRRAAQEDQQRRVTLEEQQSKAALEEQQRQAAQEDKQRLAVLEEQQRRAAQEEEQRRDALKEQQRKANKTEEKILVDIEEENIRKHHREDDVNISEEGMFKQNEEQQKTDHRINEQSSKDEIKSTRTDEENVAAYHTKEEDNQMEEQKQVTQSMDALQYYAITSTDSEKKHGERQPCSPLPLQQRNNPSWSESTEDSHTRPYRPHAPASPALSLPRSNTSSPALGTKPSMFRVKDNTMRGSSFTKSVKPRFHKNFGEDYRMTSPMGSERGEEELEIMRRSAVTPLHPDTGLNRLPAIKESSSQDYSVPLPYHRPYSRRSMALDEDDSRSVISNMSEDVESFATSAADLADLRGLCDHERPESACSFSSDVSRSLGKPPAVPPKSEKALRRAQRLTTRRIRKELSKVAADSPAVVEEPPRDVSSIPPSSSAEVCSNNRHAVASPHFSPPVSLTHAPRLDSYTEHPSSHSSFYASPHATGPISLPVVSSHATAPVSLPVAVPNATGRASQPVAPKTIADVRSSPTLHRANHPAPVTQYHVESSYPQSYPVTQRKVLQDVGSGQYFVVDVPVQVKTKTFFDPETGKYVQLNVRESAKSIPRQQPQEAYLQPQLQSQIHGKPQQQPITEDSLSGKPHMLYQGYRGYPQTPAINSVPHNKPSAPLTPHQDQQPVRESHSYGYPANEEGQIPEGHHHSPERAPYMDTVNDKDKTYNTVYNTQDPYESFPECDTSSQLAGSSVCENDNSAHPRYQPRDIITMSELDDFMELSDW